LIEITVYLSLMKFKSISQDPCSSFELF